MKVYQSKYLRLIFFKQTGILEATWLKKTELMNDSGYKKEMLNYLDILEKYDIKGILVDAVEMQFVATPELQEWLDQALFDKLTQKEVKPFLVIVQATDFVVDISVKQIMQEPFCSKVPVVYYNNIAEARDWLLNKIIQVS